MESISIEFHKVHPALSKNGRRRSHWRTQRAATEEMRETANVLILEQLQLHQVLCPSWLPPHCNKCGPMFPRATVTIHQDWSNNPLDHDGLAVSVAPALDAFIDRGIIKDDSPRFIESYKLTSSKVPHQHMNRVQITISNA